MSALIGSGLCALVVVALFAFSVDPKIRTSKALWIPVMWLLIGGSRNVDEWLQLSAPSADSTVRYGEGNPVDQVVLTTLFALGLIVLARRRLQVAAFIRANSAICIYFAYCGASLLWSDYPGVAARRFFKSLGDVTMVLVVLTDPDRFAALKRLLKRVGFVLVPISILLIRYFPQLGRGYNRAGGAYWTGVATDKNGLGMVCLVFGLVSVSHFLHGSRGRVGTGARPQIAYGAFLAMVFWLLVKADSATSYSCFLIACGVMAVASRPAMARKPMFVNLVVAALLGLSLAALFVSSTGLLGYVGRDSTLTGRTDIWRNAFGMIVNPLLGAGYESFWVGDRLVKIQSEWATHPNQAHNGYLEIYLNLGWIGVALLAVVMIKGYRTVAGAVYRETEGADLGLAYFVITCIYNCTEGAFKMMHPLWIAFLVSTTVIPELSVAESWSQRLRGSPSSRHAATAGPSTPKIRTVSGARSVNSNRWTRSRTETKTAHV